MKKIIAESLIILIVGILNLNAQIYTDKIVGKKNQSKLDSLKEAEYPYLLPIWGEKVVSKGFNLPYSAGLSMQYLWQQSDLIIENLEIGFNNGPKYNLDEIIRFDNATSTANALNIRPDIWLFPFLNVYGILAISRPSTAVEFGVYIPDTAGNSNQILSVNTNAEFDATTFGFGLTPTMGVGGIWIAMDLNFTWSDVDALEKPAFAFVFGPRFGKTFTFKNPQRNISVWTGGFRLNLNSGTSGSLALNEVLPVDELGSNLDEAYYKVDQSQQQVDAWWNSLSSTEQKNPKNVAKYETANRVLGTAGEVLDGLSGAVSTIETSTVQYSLDKRPKDRWNFIVGSQFQLNKSLMARAEFGFLGTRTQFIGGLQYRFGL